MPYLDLPIRKKSYACIKYFVLVNEPNGAYKNLMEWQACATVIRNALVERGLDRQRA